MFALGELVLSALNWAMIYILISISLNIEAGYTGIPNFGRVFAFLVGIVVTVNLLNTVYTGVCDNFLMAFGLILLSIVVSMIVGFIAGILSGLPAVKLREDYLAIFLLCLAETWVWFTYNYEPLLGGPYGRQIYADLYAWCPDATLGKFIINLIMMIALFYIIHRLLSSPFGRILKALRENELVVSVFGRNIVLYRLLAMGIGGAVAAAAGTLFAVNMRIVAVNPYMRVDWTFIPWLIVVLGGLGNNIGVAIAALVYGFAVMFFKAYKDIITSTLGIPADPVFLFNYVLLGILIIIILLYRPEGILPEKPIFTEPMKRLKTLLSKQAQTGQEMRT